MDIPTFKFGLLVLLAGIFVAAHAFAEDSSAVDLSAQARAAYAERSDMSQARRAVELFSQALSSEPDNYDLNWQLARTFWWLGDHSDKAQRIALFQSCRKVSEKAIAIAPDRTEGHYWLGVCLGRIGEETGVLKSLSLVEPIISEMDKVLAIDPQNGHAMAVLSVVYRKAPGWPLSKGSNDKSLDYARRAVAATPEIAYTHLVLAQILVENDEKPEAKTVLERIMTVPGLPDEQPETMRDQAVAQELLAGLD